MINKLCFMSKNYLEVFPADFAVVGKLVVTMKVFGVTLEVV